MKKENIYIVQFGTGSNLDLLPLAAGQLVSRLRLEKEFLKDYHLGEILFKRTDDPERLVKDLGDIFAIGFSCSLWNMNISLATACQVRQQCPEALIITGGPSIAKDPELVGPFFKKHPYVDVIVLGEGEEAWISLLKYHKEGKSFSAIPGIIYQDRKTGKVCYGQKEEILSLPDLPSPFLDGTFDEFYANNKHEFSGIIWETNRGCPFTCTFCTWGNYTSRKVRYKSMEQIEREIDWIGRNKIKYIALTDANFGIKDRDVEIARLLAACKVKYGGPDFISVSWVKNSSNKVLAIGDILRAVGVKFRVTLALQSTNQDVLRAIHRSNMKREAFETVKDVYHQKRLFSYAELILALPMETHESYMNGIEECLSNSVYDQIYLYPLFLFPNTELSSPASIKQYGMIGKTTAGGYTKAKHSDKIGETVEIIIGTSTMPKDKWVDSYVLGFFTSGMHGDRILFFVTEYLRNEYGIRITELFKFARDFSAQENLSMVKGIFEKLRRQALSVQNEGTTHLIEPQPFGGFCYDPPQAAFLEMLYYREKFFPEFFRIIEAYLHEKNISFDRELLEDLFVFQEAVMAHPNGPSGAFINLKFDWVGYFMFAFNFDRTELKEVPHQLKVVDDRPCHGDTERFLKEHFDVRGIPAFNKLYNEQGVLVFPPVELEDIMVEKQTNAQDMQEHEIPEPMEKEEDIFVM